MESISWNNKVDYALDKNTISVIAIDLRNHAEQESLFLNLLSPDERARHNRFHFQRDKIRFCISHGWLRQLLGNFLDTDPYEIEFTKCQYGKPVIQLDQNPQNLHFNLSHSGDFAVYAFSYDTPIGVDIEHIERKVDGDAIAKRFFSDVEFNNYIKLNNTDRITAFFNIWTRKEAFIKAVGQGLSYPLKDFDVNGDIDKPAELLRIKDNTTPTQWHLSAFCPHMEYMGALALESNPKKINYTLL